MLGAGFALLARPHTTRAASGTAALRWTAPGDDGQSGRATLYDLRYSTSPITAVNFTTATHVPGLPAPALSGSNESFMVTGLIVGQTYYFALRTADEVANWSVLSNVSAFMAGSGTTATLPGSPGVSLSRAWPSPARESSAWTFTLPKAADVELEVFDVHGRRVRTLLRASVPAGEREARWDLRDDRGQRVPAGVYLMRAALGSDVLMRRVVVLH